MASSCSHSVRAGGRGGLGGSGYDGLGSPVAYRVSPLGYEPEVKCDCGKKACRWTSWSDYHLGRRYYRCSRARTRDDCGLYEWIDKELSAWYKQLLVDLRDEVWKLRKAAADEGTRSAMVDVEATQVNQFLQEELLKKDSAL